MTFGELKKLSGNDDRVCEVVRGVLHDVAVLVEKLANFLIDTGHTLRKMMEKTLHFNDSHRDLMREQICIKNVEMGLGWITEVIGILREKSNRLNQADAKKLLDERLNRQTDQVLDVIDMWKQRNRLAIELQTHVNVCISRRVLNARAGWDTAS